MRRRRSAKARNRVKSGTRNAPWVVQVLRDDQLLFIKRHHRKEDALAEARRQLANRPGSLAVLVYEEIAWAR